MPFVCLFALVELGKPDGLKGMVKGLCAKHRHSEEGESSEQDFTAHSPEPQGLSSCCQPLEFHHVVWIALSQQAMLASGVGGFGLYICFPWAPIISSTNSGASNNGNCILSWFWRLKS